MTPFNLMIAFAIAFCLAYYWLTRPEPPPSNLEEDITRRAISKISWRRRPSVTKLKSGPWNPSAPEQGTLVTIPFDNSREVKLLFSEGTVEIYSRHDFTSRVELADPDSLDRLAGTIERVWAAQYK